MTTSGTIWEIEKQTLPPIMTHYVRQNLSGIMNPPMAQEALTLAMAVDTLLRGRPAAACDIISRRLKALEAMARGSHWTVARQLELIRADGLSMTEESESLEAARRARDEERLRQRMTRTSGPRSPDTNSMGNGKKGKEGRQTGKGKTDETGKGKGNEGRKDELKNSWQKKDK